MADPVACLGQEPTIAGGCLRKALRPTIHRNKTTFNGAQPDETFRNPARGEEARVKMTDVRPTRER